MTPPVTVLLVDDHILVRRGSALSKTIRIAVVGEAATRRKRSINGALAEGRPDGLRAARRERSQPCEILEQSPPAAVLILSMHSEAALVQRAIEAGARGYLLKSAIDLDLPEAVRRAAAGQLVLDPKLARAATSRAERTRELSARETEVLQLICEGLSNRDIATRLSLSANTVAVHRANIMSALGVHKTAELVVYAIQHGLVDLK